MKKYQELQRRKGRKKDRKKRGITKNEGNLRKR